VTIDEVMPPAAPKVADFDYPDFYRAMVEREHLQVARDEAKWTEKHTSPERKIEVLLNFGCNVRQTPHLMREAVAVLEVLGVDFHAVAGQQFCCGKPYSGNGLKDAARGVVETSVRRMASYRPDRAIQWCSACEMQFHDVVIPDVGIEFQSDGLAKYLVEKIDSMEGRVPWRRDVNVRAAIHGHLGEHVVRDAHPPVTIELLKFPSEPLAAPDAARQDSQVSRGGTRVSSSRQSSGGITASASAAVSSSRDGLETPTTVDPTISVLNENCSAAAASGTSYRAQAASIA